MVRVFPKPAKWLNEMAFIIYNLVSGYCVPSMGDWKQMNKWYKISWQLVPTGMKGLLQKVVSNFWMDFPEYYCSICFPTLFDLKNNIAVSYTSYSKNKVTSAHQEFFKSLLQHFLVQEILLKPLIHIIVILMGALMVIPNREHLQKNS